MDGPSTPPVKKAFSSAVPNSRPVATGDMKTKLIQRLIDFRTEPEVNKNNNCKKYLKSYQTACGKQKDSDEEKKRIFESAKTMIVMIFGNVHKGRNAIRQIEENHPTNNVIDPMPLEQFEQVEQLILPKMRILSDDKQKIVFTVIDKYLKKWEDCYQGRRMYRMSCENTRDENHDVAYWIFKLAYLAGKVVKNKKSELDMY